MGQGMEAGKGAVGGAMTGASLGAVGGPLGVGLGAAAGGLLGGLGGYFGSAGDDEYTRILEEAKRRGISPDAAYSSFRTNQTGLINRLEAMSQGQGPSVATENFRQATDRGGAQQMALAQSGRGNPGAMGMQALNNAAMINAQGQQTLQGARAQEQRDATQQLGLAIYGARGADEDMNRFNYQGRVGQDQFNQSLQLQALAGQAGQGPGMGDQLLSMGGTALGGYLAQRGNQGQGRPQAPGQQVGGMAPVFTPDEQDARNRAGYAPV